MINIFIGICAVLAVVMIVIGGMEYMTSELVSTKEAGRHRINEAILGLLIALGSYALLNSINPDLLNSDIAVPPTLLQYAEQESYADVIKADTGSIPSGAITGCTEGLTQVKGSIRACKSISQNISNMITAAEKDGLNISGSGYRSIERQTELRKSNCKGNTTDPRAICTPPTAIPGASLHNRGLALDLTCAGELIQARDNVCFLWLQKNAGTYGFSNFSKEPWHWSTTGS